MGDLGNDKAVSPPFDNYEEVESDGLNLRVEWDISDSVTFTSITGPGPISAARKPPCWKALKARKVCHG